MEKTVKQYVREGDFIKCVDCEQAMLVEIGTDRCPKCGSQNLMWMDEAHPECDVADLEEMGYRVFLQVGTYDKTGGIDRKWYRQGFIVKDEEAFLHYPDQVCYVPELGDEVYTRQDFLNLCNGQEDFAEACFYGVDWQSPETWIDEQLREDEWGWCDSCKKFYRMDGEAIPCPVCEKPVRKILRKAAKWLKGEEK